MTHVGHPTPITRATCFTGFRWLKCLRRQDQIPSSAGETTALRRAVLELAFWEHYKVRLVVVGVILGFLCDRMTKKIIKRISPNSQKWPSWTNMVIKCSWEIIKCNGTWYPVLSPAHPLHRYMRFYISKRNGLNVIRSTFFIIPFTLCASWSWLTKFFIRISSHCCSYRLQSI